MPAAAETYSLGAPVEIGKIEKELKKLWQQSEGAMTRASLMNLAAYSEQPGSLNNNTQLMAKITEDHACRAIVVGRNSSSRSEAAPGLVRLKLDASGPCPLRGRAVLRSSCFASSPNQNQ